MEKEIYMHIFVWLPWW